MNTHRLQVLARHLRTLPQVIGGTKFNLESWVSLPWGARPAEGAEIPLSLIKATCGSTCCAIGSCGSIQEFRDAGFSIRVTKLTAVPFYNGYENWPAVEAFFDLSESDTERLFADHAYPKRYDPETEYEYSIATPGDVADRIDELTCLSSKSPSLKVLL